VGDPGRPLSEGISPVQGADRNGPTAVIKSAAKMDHVKTGGTLLNMKLTPSLLAGELQEEIIARTEHADIAGPREPMEAEAWAVSGR